jgi:excisionase family DNA binding protein
MTPDQQLAIDFVATPMPPEPTRRQLPPTLVSVVDAAAALGIGRSKMYELIAAGEIEVVHIGRSVRVPVEEIDEFVDRLRAARRRTATR